MRLNIDRSAEAPRFAPKVAATPAVSSDPSADSPSALGPDDATSLTQEPAQREGLDLNGLSPEMTDVSASLPAPKTAPAAQTSKSQGMSLYDSQPSGSLQGLLQSPDLPDSVGASDDDQPIHPFEGLPNPKNGLVANLPDGMLPSDVKNDPALATLKEYTSYRQNWISQSPQDDQPYDQQFNDSRAPYTLAEYLLVKKDGPRALFDSNGDRLATPPDADPIAATVKQVEALDQKLGNIASQFKVYDSNKQVDPLGLVKKVVAPGGQTMYMVLPGKDGGNGKADLEGWRNDYVSLSPNKPSASYMQAREAAAQKAYDEVAAQRAKGIQTPETPDQAKQKVQDQWLTSLDTDGDQVGKRNWAWDVSAGDWGTGTKGGNFGHARMDLLDFDPIAGMVSKGIKSDDGGLYDGTAPRRTGSENLDAALPAIIMTVATAGIAGPALGAALAETEAVGSVAAATGLSAETVASVASQIVIGGFRAGMEGGNVGQGMLTGALSGGLGSVFDNVIPDGMFGNSTLGDYATDALRGAAGGVVTGAATHGDIGHSVLRGAVSGVSGDVSDTLGDGLDALGLGDTLGDTVGDMVTHGLQGAVTGAVGTIGTHGNVGAAMLHGAAGEVSGDVSDLVSDGLDDLNVGDVLGETGSDLLAGAVSGGLNGAIGANGTAGGLDGAMQGVVAGTSQGLQGAIHDGLPGGLNSAVQGLVNNAVNQAAQHLRKPAAPAQHPPVRKHPPSGGGHS